MRKKLVRTVSQSWREGEREKEDTQEMRLELTVFMLAFYKGDKIKE